jgi:FeS assembly protein IscX
MKHTWRDVDELALDLIEQHPYTDPLSVGLSELKRLVLGLPTFEDDPKAVDEHGLEAIQRAWYDEYED